MSTVSTGFYFDPLFLAHDTGPGHPERPQRLRAILERLEQDGLWSQLEHRTAAPAPTEWITALHDPAYVQAVLAACRDDLPLPATSDTPLCRQSADAALLATGAVCAATEAVWRGELDNAFCAVRPPGHHAERDHATGFCLFNHLAIAADRLIRLHGAQRVAIVDFDVHHGNGTQHLLEERPEILVISLHEHPLHLYPGTGFTHERGRGAGTGYTLNLPLDPHSGDAIYQGVFRKHVLPALADFAPQMLLVSAGYDAAAEDPLAHMDVSTEGFSWIAHRLKEAAETHCQGKVVFSLEGGYHLRALAAGVACTLRVLLAEPGEDPLMSLKAGF